MPGLAMILLLALSAPAEQVGDRRLLAIEGLRARQPIQRLEGLDPCELAREIASQPACLASRDCPALRAWERAFGSPRFELLDPERPADLSLASGRRPGARATRALFHWRPALRPGLVCPVGEPHR